MSSLSLKNKAHQKRKRRIRKKIAGTPERPRLTVFRSLRHISAQVIDDTRGHTMASASSTEKAVREQPKFEDKTAVATFVGKLLGERAIEKGIQKVVFDRNGSLYHGRVKAVSNGAREAGLEF